MPFPPVPLHRPLAKHHRAAILIHAILTHPPPGSLTPFLLINRTFYTALAHLPYTSVQLHEGNVLGFYAGLGGDCGGGAERGDGGKDVKKLGDEDIIRRPSRAPSFSTPLLARKLLLISRTVHLTMLDAPSFLLTIHAISLFRELLVSQLNAHILHYFDSQNKRLALFQGCQWLVFGEQLWKRIQEEKRGNKVMPRLLIKMGYGWHNASLCVPVTRDKVSRSLVTALGQFLEQDSFRKVVLHGARMEDWCADFGESAVEAYLCEDTEEGEDKGKGSKRDEGVKVWAKWIHDLLEHHLDKTTHRHRYLSHQTLLLSYPSTTQSLGEAIMSIPEGRYMTRVVVKRGGLSKKGKDNGVRLKEGEKRVGLEWEERGRRKCGGCGRG
ncbi:hypothetical protein L198_06086 [Cryptococcus wingfieldii CBS 7118]|uniref:Uncharacterized protein n=1 Tax=Cryptococcus wingfieldii CBS 7118 TaxID=1295528 RepID=A0A1E3IQ89_9TREE|nr:hypothetical protein L198_06086 [Cryptococcus wingfieldii CBS 7118]ODN90770.1 hypothetical protein L198_06086 [Cryptococcus wingfieldii CBS 7118]